MSEWDEFKADESWDEFKPEQTVKNRIANAFSSHLNRLENRDAERLGRVAYGAREPLQAGAQVLANIAPESVQKAASSADKWLYENTGGLLGSQEPDYNKRLTAQEAAYKKPGGLDAERLAGNMLGGLLLSASGGPGILGAAKGAAANTIMQTPVYDTEGGRDYAKKKALQGTIGGLLGGALQTIGIPIQKIMAPNMTQQSGIEDLVAEGIQPTIGQRFGGTLQEVENKMTSAPILGPAIIEAKTLPIKQFNEATIDRAARELSGNIGPRPQIRSGNNVGPEALAALKDANDFVYTQALNATGKVDLSSTNFKRKLAPVFQEFNKLSDEAKKDLTKRFTGWDQISSGQANSPEAAKGIISEINDLIPIYKRSMAVDDTYAAKVLEKLKDSIHEQISEQNPAARELLRNADTTFAQRVRIENAANRGKGEIFSPGNLVAAVKASDKSARKGDNATGRAYMQDWANLNESLLGSRVPDSGTVGRYGMLYAMSHPIRTLVNTPAGLAIALGTAAQTPERQLAIAKHLQKKESPLEQLTRELLMRSIPGAIGGITRP